MTAIISARILALVASGSDLPAAFDTVLGAGQYAALAGSLYVALRTEG